jgi:prepilin-type processing-associated H-X9-DG protein
MLLPALARAKDKAKQADCIGRVRQLNASIQMYTSDNDETLMHTGFFNPAVAIPGTGNSVDGSNVNWWRYLLIPQYMSDWEGILCPAAPRSTSATWPSGPGHQITRHYGYNTFLGSLRIGKVKNTDIMGMIGDCSHWLITSGGCNQLTWAFPAQENRAAGLACNANQAWNQTSAQTRHLQGSNISFVDGHVEWLYYRQIQAWTTKYYRP